MTQQPAEPFGIPPETLGWRLKRALDWGGVSAKEMATELDVSEGTISRWSNDVGAPPRSIYLRAWAHKCRVPFEWLSDPDLLNRSTITRIRGDQLVLNEISAQAKHLDDDAVAELRRSLGHGTRQTNRRVRSADQQITHSAARS